MFVCESYKGEVWSILAQQSGEHSLSLDTLLVLEHIAVHEAIQHGGVGMDVDVELQTNPLMERAGEGDREGWTADEIQQVSAGRGSLSDSLSNSPRPERPRWESGMLFLATGILRWGEAVTQGTTTNPPDSTN